ncbi:MAG: 2Fe-2S iron-sulfur cluster binding domain-containing protein [Hyphomicrobiales bacterium]|nr:MAG: 2Fe-2S iron-sulfur cluster binding domain-containing protein [Hyphomicrobiales bacterium]
MPIVTFVMPSGRVVRIEAEVGESLLAVALANDVEGILGECGGCLACGTCHVFVAEAFTRVLPPPAADEEALLDFAANRRTGSRLCCQIRVSQALDGIVLDVPGQD